MFSKCNKFIELYNEVFDESNNIRACGRNKCIKLIECAEAIDSNKNFGSVESGMMNISNIIELYNYITNNK